MLPLLSPPRPGAARSRAGAGASVSASAAAARPAVILPWRRGSGTTRATTRGSPRRCGTTTASPRPSWRGSPARTGSATPWASLTPATGGAPSARAPCSIGECRPLPPPRWRRGGAPPRYLKRVDDAVSEARELCPPGGKISLIGHSAGGWLARVYMAEFEASDISLLLTLGTPHLPPPKGVPGVIDQTRGLLNYVEKNCAPAVYTPELRYVCIAGRYIQGAPLLGNSAVASNEILAVDTPSEGGEAAIISSSEKSTSSGVTWRARFVGQGYKQVCGRADVWGDGVVPEMAAHLEGALNISFDGVYHSPVGSDDEQRPWYGSPAILKQWVHHLLS